MVLRLLVATFVPQGPLIVGIDEMVERCLHGRRLVQLSVQKSVNPALDSALWDLPWHSQNDCCACYIRDNTT